MNAPNAHDSVENTSMAVAFTDDDDETGLTPAHPAATLVIFDESQPAAPPQLLMVRRASTMAFAAGAAVFPGGRVDPDDRDLAARHATVHGLDPADAAARVAAIRETVEETGLIVGLTENAIAHAAAMRAQMVAGTVFSEVLAQYDVAIDWAALTPFARWRPNFAHARTFDTRFYIARLAGSRPQLDVDRGENSALFWLDATTALAKADAGDLHVIFPTRRNLERLALFDTHAAACADAQRHPPRRITPWIEEREGERHLCIRDDCGYPVTSEPMHSAMRG